ncbi:hypothetical protein FSP39_001810 [Pinctada imbricata]|uniref:PDZ domain-containing protein n=1 Tax=Pinctada imbricata TaxID=66713 RepID=A0AA88YAI1_PINIB|nr:hypothetical protein FSP39_001810 [Pinctada imbricata]
MGENENKPRLCHLVKWPDFQGYGFNLHAERGKAGQFIGKVDDGSPALAAGLKDGDRIVEINGINIGNENHQQVVGRIKAGGDEVTILVVDSETDKYYKDMKQIVRNDLPEVVKMSAAREQQNGEDNPDNQPESEPPSEPSEPEPPREPSPEPEPEREPEPEPEPEPAKEEERLPEPEPEQVSTQEDTPAVEEVVVNANGVNVEEDDESSRYIPRLCHVTKWPDFQGYGFNLHAERDKPGQYIGNIDSDSPAEEAGLRKGDRIIEINGVNIENESHQQVIQRVKAVPNETTMLLLDDAADKYYKDKGITVNSSMPNVMKLENKPREATVNGTSDQPSQVSQPAPAASPVTQAPPPSQPSANGDPLADMSKLSAKEMRELLKSRRKQDPKKGTGMDFKSKVEMAQRM